MASQKIPLSFFIAKNKECKTCHEHLAEVEFEKGRRVCKLCRAAEARARYNEKKFGKINRELDQGNLTSFTRAKWGTNDAQANFIASRTSPSDNAFRAEVAVEASMDYTDETYSELDVQIAQRDIKLKELQETQSKLVEELTQLKASIAEAQEVAEEKHESNAEYLTGKISELRAKLDQLELDNRAIKSEHLIPLVGQVNHLTAKTARIKMPAEKPQVAAKTAEQEAI